MGGVAIGIIKRALGACVHGRDGVARGGVPVPEGEGEGVIIDEAGQDALMEIKVPSVPREEEPRVVHLVLDLGALLIVGAVAEGTVNVGLLRVLARIAGRQLAQQLVSLVVLGYVGLADLVGGDSGAEGQVGGELEVGDCGRHRQAAVNSWSTVSRINWSGASLEIWWLDGAREGRLRTQERQAGYSKRRCQQKFPAIQRAQLRFCLTIRAAMMAGAPWTEELAPFS